MFNFPPCHHRLNVIEAALSDLLRNQRIIMATVAEVAASEAASTASIDALIAIAEGQAATLKDISAKLVAAGTDATALDALNASILAEKSKVDAVVAANTPAPAPAPVAPAAS